MPKARTRGNHPAIVVGAGPAGMSAALALRARGLPALVVEAGPEGRPRPGSRAIYVHRETLAHLEGLVPGLGREIARRGLVWATKRTFWGGREVFSRTYPPPAPGILPPSTSLAQVRTEELLQRACKQAGVEFAWNAEVSGVAACPDGVTVSTAAGQQWTADYVIGADGARSAVRTAVDLPLTGDRSANSFVIVDLEEDPDRPLPAERVFHYAHPAVGGRNVLLVPFAGGWRADLACRADDNPADFAATEGVRRWVSQVMPERYADRISWVSTYQFLQVLARDFTDASRRVLLVGEAAHLFAPFGARGMNSGIPDAIAAAAAVAAGLDAGDRQAAEQAVGEFAAARREAAEYNRAAAAAALAHMQSRSPAMLVRRAAAARLAMAGQRAGAWLDSAPYGPRAGARGAGKGTY